MTLLEVTGLRVSLAGTGDVLRGVDLRVGARECLAIVGESGAGKSVLARTLLGLTQGEPGARVHADVFSLGERDVRGVGRRGWRRLRGREVSLVLQDALQSLDPLRTVEAEVGETLAVRRVGPAERRRRVVSALEAAGLPDASRRLRQRPGELSGGMRQRVLIASAVVGGARLIVADEPTTALDATTAVHVLDLLARLRDEGAGLILISHDLSAVARVADRIAVIDAGGIVETGVASTMLGAPAHPVTRALIAAAPRGPKPAPVVDAGRVLLRGRALVRRYRSPGGGTTAAVDGVDVTVRAGETLGVVGESGSGKSTLARLLVGAERPDSGALEPGSPPPRLRLVPQDPLASFDPRLTVERILRHALRDGAPSPAELLARVGLAPAILDRRPATLSGGQRQRVAIARALAGRPDVLVCDEPVSALDVTTQAEVLRLLAGLQREDGLGVVFISHDLAVVRVVSDRVAVMRHGRVVEEGPTEAVYAAPEHPFTRELIAAGGGRTATPRS
ncbi:ABC transporter ATP-binding protein [Microbacterium betulae]|uniref:ABC transporter ATP-binding protein n=1 Tax=Microbacterium betulae TaxID=2981139 RepID=A0AA97FG30_9MICO|nr:ABC transporter ATP-binding protein [Microbacterium sp. AB]WOF21605.1 ABC transporter ATP-binding protein [Microbacterium sp. AB]